MAAAVETAALRFWILRLVALARKREGGAGPLPHVKDPNDFLEILISRRHDPQCNSFEIEPIRRLWRLALPLIIANISAPILGLADAAISGHLDHAYYLAAVTVGAELLVVFFGAFSFCVWGRRHGRSGGRCKDHSLSFSILSHAIALATIIGIGLLVLGSQATAPILELAQAPAEMHRPLEEYLETRLWGAPPTFLLLVLPDGSSEKVIPRLRFILRSH